MNNMLSSLAAPAVVLGIDFQIDQNEGLRRTLRASYGIRNQAIHLRIDPSMDLIYLTEIQLPGTLPCLESLTQPGIAAVLLRKAQLVWHPSEESRPGRQVTNLSVLETGSCFLTANNRKIHIASFVNQQAHATRLSMTLLGQPNLLEFLRTDSFTVEISGTNRRRLLRALRFSVRLEFEVIPEQVAYA